MAVFTALTRDQYVSLVKGYLAEDRYDTTTDEKLYPDADIIMALDAGQCDIIRVISSTMSFFRKTSLVNAATGNIAFPADYLTDLNAQLVTGTSDLDRRPLTVLFSNEMNQVSPYWNGLASVAYPTYLVAQFTSSGPTLTFSPPITSAITNGLLFDYAVSPDTLSTSSSTSPVMTLFPELQMTLLPFAACRVLTLFTGGADDDQYQKFDNLFMRDIGRMRMAINSRFSSPKTYGRR